jgi:hypothetical protein
MRYLKKSLKFEFFFAAAILAIHLYAALSDAYNFPNTWFTRDDAYYYFKVAQNIVEGRGSTFDGINPTNGYHPFWLVLCLPVFFFARYDLILPLRILLMVMAVFNALTGILIYRLSRVVLSQPAAMIAAPFWSFNFYIHYTVYEFGLESPLAAFAIALILYRLVLLEREGYVRNNFKRSLVQLSLAAVLVLFSRLDLIFLVAVIGVWIIFRNHPMRNLLPIDLAIFFLSLTASIALRGGIRLYNEIYAYSALQLVALAFLSKPLLFYLFGMYQHPRSQSLGSLIIRLTIANLIGSLFILLVYSLLTRLGVGGAFPGIALVYDWGTSLFLTFALRLAYYGITKEAVAGPSARALDDLKRHGKRWATEAAIYYGMVGSALAAYMGINKLVFDTYTPISGQIKRWWGMLGYTVYDKPAGNWPDFLGIVPQGVYSAWQPAVDFFKEIAAYIKPLYPGSNTQDERYYIVLASAAALVVVFAIIFRDRLKQTVAKSALIPLFSGCAIHILAYTTTAYGGAKEWYWIGQMLFVILATAVLIDATVHLLDRSKYLGYALQVLALIVGGNMVLRLADFVTTVMRYDYYSPDRPYMEVLPFLEENTPENAVIGMTGGGNVGYFIHNRTIVNMDGLINSPEYFKAVQAGTAATFLKEHGVMVVFANPRLLEYPPYYGQFAPYLQSYATHGGKDLLYLLEEPKY